MEAREKAARENTEKFDKSQCMDAVCTNSRAGHEKYCPTHRREMECKELKRECIISGCTNRKWTEHYCVMHRNLEK